jgi:hypothetical protein
MQLTNKIVKKQCHLTFEAGSHYFKIFISSSLFALEPKLFRLATILVKEKNKVQAPHVS